MLLRLILIVAVLVIGYQFASGAIFVSRLALSSTFAWMYEDY